MSQHSPYRKFFWDRDLSPIIKRNNAVIQLCILIIVLAAFFTDDFKQLLETLPWRSESGLPTKLMQFAVVPYYLVFKQDFRWKDILNVYVYAIVTMISYMLAFVLFMLTGETPTFLHGLYISFLSKTKAILWLNICMKYYMKQREATFGIVEEELNEEANVMGNENTRVAAVIFRYLMFFLDSAYTSVLTALGCNLNRGSQKWYAGMLGGDEDSEDDPDLILADIHRLWIDRANENVYAFTEDDFDAICLLILSVGMVVDEFGPY